MSDLQRVNVQGRPATVAFLTGFTGELTDLDHASVAIVNFDDGELGFYELNEPRTLGDKEGHEFHGNQYVYHGTAETNLASIKEHGLRPSEYGNPLNFHYIESTSRDYAMFDGNDRPQAGVLLRVKRSDLPKDTTHDSLTERAWTKTVVPPDVIEIEHEGTWKPLRTANSFSNVITRVLSNARDAIRWKLGMAMAANDKDVATEVITDASDTMRVELEQDLTTLGDKLGHEFHGNQWDELGIGGRPEGYEAPAVVSVKEAIPLILAGKIVELKNVHKVNTLLTKLAAIAKDAKKKGEHAPNYDACKITVAGASVFCGGSLRTKDYPNGLPRIVMPQLGGTPRSGSKADQLHKDDKGRVDAGPEFIDYLDRLGISSKSESVYASHLIASQAELNGPTIAKRVAQNEYAPSSPIFISRDNYIIDGHHRWASIVGRDAADNRLGDLKVRAIRVDAPISEVLHIAQRWSKKFGLPGAKA